MCVVLLVVTISYFFAIAGRLEASSRNMADGFSIEGSKGVGTEWLAWFRFSIDQDIFLPEIIMHQSASHNRSFTPVTFTISLLQFGAVVLRILYTCRPAFRIQIA